MSEQRIRRVVVVGGGTAGWMAATLLARALGEQVAIELVESETIGTVGVGEATIPSIRLVNRFLGLDEDTLLREVQGTFKLGIQFNDWGRIGDSYLHAFGDVGIPLGLIPFQHYWLRSRQNAGAPDLWAYSLNAQAALAGRFGRLERVGDSPLTGIRYAYHFDASLYAAALRRHAGQHVTRTEGRIVEVCLRPEDGFIEAVRLEDGRRVAGDLFIDCSGFRGLLIGEALQGGYEDWRDLLPCDRAIAIPSANAGPPRPFTQSSARTAGWQWRIPLQHRTGNGHVFCSRFMSEDEATAILLDNLEGEPLAEPRALRFTTGMRRQTWTRNCVALGLAAGFMEPLESTSIHLVQSGVSRLIAMFPDRGCDAALRDEYNRQTRFEYERIRDFLVLHYHATERRDTPFWQHCATMDIPASLTGRLALFRASGGIFRDADELFTEPGWLQVMLGQRIAPGAYHASADALDPAALDGFLGDLRTLIGRAVAGLPAHGDFVAGHCPAPAPR